MTKPKSNGHSPKQRNFRPSNTSPSLDDATKLIELMGETGLAELDLEMPQFKMSLRREVQTRMVPEPVRLAPAFDMPAVALPQPNGAAQPAPVPPKAEKLASPPSEAYHQIVSPMVGTFYRAPSPTSPPYVKEGDLVTAGQPICIVEAMKLMNEIKADRAGKVVRIPVENAAPVEKGTILFELGEASA